MARPSHFAVTLRSPAQSWFAAEGVALLRLTTLGSLELTRADGTPLSQLLRQPRRMAVLLYLVARRQRGSLPREALRGVFWAESPESRARRALNQALYVLRSVLGPGVLESRGELELVVHHDALWCDAVAFDRAVEGRSLVEALRLYRGDFLPAFSVPGAPEFERWVESTRSRLRLRAADAAARLCDSAWADGRLREALRWARRRLELTPTDEVALRELLTLLADAGDRAGAAEAYRTFAHDLASHLDMAPSPETQELLRAIRSESARTGKRVVAARAASRSASHARGAMHPPTPPEPNVPIRPAPRRRGIWLTVAASLLAAFGIADERSGSGRSMHDTRDRVSAESLTRVGRLFWNRRSAGNLEIAIGLFTRAVAADGRYAPGYSGLADAYTLLAWYGSSSGVDPVSQARAAAWAAVHLNDELAETHTSLAGVKAWFDHDWPGAVAEYRRAIALDSGYSTAHQWYALGLASQGQLDEAVREMRTARRRDPSSPAIATDLATLLFWSGRDREAMTQIRSALLLDPAYFRAHAQLWRLYAAAGRGREALAALEQVIGSGGGAGGDIARLRRAYGRHGLRGALEWWSHTLAHSARSPDRAFRIAVLCGLLNRNDAALRWLREARDERSPFVQFAAIDPAFRGLRRDPQFVRIVAAR